MTTMTSPWHAGELALQDRAGVKAKMDNVGRRVVRDYMPDQHRNFYEQLPFVVAGSVAPDGDVWATLAFGHPGFLHSPADRVLQVETLLDPADPASAGLADGDSVGLLGIELHTRRRNRMNGRIRRQSAERFEIDVGQSFGNCPQYIQLRDAAFVREPGEFSDIAPEESATLDARARAMIARADTFFVASYVDAEEGRQVDVSHRGGRTGFVRIDEDGRLTIPDFAGNLFFATLGNFMLNPKAGLLFADFESGDVLQLTGEAEVELDSPDVAAFQGAERLWHFTPRRVIYRAAALPLRWAFRGKGWSPNSLMTGDWSQATQRQKAAELAQTWRPFRIASVVDESRFIRSFVLEPADGAGLIPHLAGQHLPVRMTIGTPLLRTYTLSTAPSDGVYRISVKRDGVFSSHLHDAMKVGDVLEARAPAGAFTIDAAEPRPAVFLAAGVGVTPMLAMLRHVVYEGLRKRRVRPTWFFQSARHVADQAFGDELRQLQDAAGGAVKVVRSLSDTAGAQAGRDYEASGRIDMALLRRSLPFDDYDFYLCGPAGFMQALYDGLRDLNVADERIHAEAFGPSGLKRRGAAPAEPVSMEEVPVAFVATGKEARWSPASGSLLDLAESRGLTPPFSCRGGSCGSCSTKIAAGTVTYAQPPAFPVAEGEALICCAVPAQGSERIMLEL